MPDPRLLEHDPYTGMTEYFHVIEDGQWAIETRQDVSGIIEVNKALQNDATGRWGEMTHVASIPLTILMDLVQQGILDTAFHVQDDARYRKWLNAPENRVWRTKLGKV